MKILWTLLLFFPLSLTSQETNYLIEISDSTLLKIKSLEKTSQYPLKDVAILSENGDTLVLTGANGRAEVRVPKETKYFYASHSGHQNLKFRPKRDFILNRKLGSVVMKPVDTLQYGSFWRHRKHTVTLAVNEMVNYALAVKYTQHFKRKEAYGLQLSIYTVDLLNIAASKENYSGFKLSGFYQYYLVNNLNAGIYFEPKLSFGYFDANNIAYYRGEGHVHRSKKFWTGGAGLSIGFLAYASDRVVFGFSLGLQYFPAAAPNTIIHNGTEYSRKPTYDIEIPFWEGVGPGAVVDFSFLIGVKF